jgi:hypothetical protein
LEATNVTSQRVQIALFRLQQRLDAARTHLAEAQNEWQHMAGAARTFEETVNNATDPNEKKTMQQRLVRP